MVPPAAPSSTAHATAWFAVKLTVRPTGTVVVEGVTDT
jgi:hypothetical protein